MNMPQDPILLLSMTNTYLRDQYSSLDALCEDRDWDKDELVAKLKAVDYEYIPEQNQFK